MKLRQRVTTQRRATAGQGIFLAGLLLATLLGGCGGDGEATVPFETIAKGIDSSLGTQRLDAIREEAQWRDFWAAHTGKEDPPPSVDFSRDMVVVVHLGSKPSRNAEVQIDRIESNSVELLVHYTEIVPRSGCLTRGFFSQPHHIVRLGRTNAQPAFFRSELIHDCT